MLPTTVHQSTEIAEPVKANTFPGVIIGVVTSMAMFSIILLLLVPLSIAVIVIMFENQWWVGITGVSETSGCFR